MSDEQRSRLSWLATAAAGLAAAPFVVAAVVWANLPDPLATHWGLSDAPNGHTPKLVFFGGAAIVVIGLGVAVAVGVRRSADDPRRQRLLLLYALGGSTFCAALLGLIIAAGLGAPTWTASTLPPASVPLALLLPLATVAAAARVVPVPPLPARADARPGDRGSASVGLTSRERAVWFGGAHSHGLLVVTPAIAVATALAGVLRSDWWLVAVGIVILLAGLATASVSVRIDSEAVRVGFGPLGWPAKVVRLREVLAARAIDVDPLAWGGWGYRWMPTKQATAAVVRKGPGLRLERTDGRVFVVTVDDAERAAGLVNDYLAR